ncbi:hypothetical protein N7457_000699 [Penicillium paradoxum]|uniref:uncharacterized protein n=1 Tax=Penicillium paradoxum TaxID=176176 RepID=UPI0025473492|nr:uncharacterized protein N7457_000699 [Penicillium paradoxum]KAJ5794100.1 hypothetical protein N7457_000699 [Penicillium paradoxum]
MSALPILVKRAFSFDQSPPRNEPPSSPAKKRRVDGVDEICFDTPVHSGGSTDFQIQNIDKTIAAIERASSLRSAYGDENLPIECNCPPLRGRSDYRLWRRRIRLVLSHNFLLELIDGEFAKLPRSHRLEYELDRLKAAAEMIINNNLSPITKPIVRNLHEPHEMWEKLEKHCKPSDWSCTRSGWLDLQNIRYSQCSDIWEYVYRVDDAWRCICLDREDVLEKHELARCASLMCGLDAPKWEGWKMGLLSGRKANIPSWEDLVESLTLAEDKGLVCDAIGMAI